MLSTQRQNGWAFKGAGAETFAENEIFGDIVWLKNSFPLGTGNG